MTLSLDLDTFIFMHFSDKYFRTEGVEFLDSIKGYMNKSFSMKDLGEAAYILGIKIYRDRSKTLDKIFQ